MSEIIPVAAHPSSRVESRYVTHSDRVLAGEPIIADTQVAVRDIVSLWQSGVKPEDIPRHLFNLVTVAQVFDALSFYCDAPEDVDPWIKLYADHPSPLSRLNPLWDNFTQNVAEHRREVDAKLES